MSSPSFEPKYTRATEADPDLIDSGLLDALSGFDVDSNLAVVQRTRRAVMAAAHQLKAARLKRRKQIGIMLVTLFGMLILMTPALWSVTDDVFADEHFFDMPAMTMSIVLTLLSTLFAALILHWRSRRVRDEEKY
ncbi:hypothetical protein [Silvibacterium acidisoli]|uniref:hypothetical protein n=1 Tax=Acidobacteriaceae bacterium ZG23-2 TaxID=2883246 RepID=UPI00406CE424